MFEGQVTRDPLILNVRRLWQAGLTLSQAAKDYRLANEDTSLVIAEWRRLKRLFRCASLPHSYLLGYRDPRPATKDEIDRENAQPVGSLAGGTTYGDWSGRTGPGRQLREMLATDTSE